METETERIQRLSLWYGKEQLTIDRRLIRERFTRIRPHLKGPSGLELGPGDGEMTPLLAGVLGSLTVVDASPALLAPLAAPRVKTVCSLFEDFQPTSPFDTIVADHILEHIADPVAILTRARSWLAPAGRIVVGVPNARSIHRLAAVRMGLLRAPDELNDRDLRLGHRRVYTWDTLARDVTAAGLTIVARGGCFLKPLSHAQIEEQWTESMVDAFFALGEEFPEISAEIFTVCATAPSGR